MEILLTSIGNAIGWTLIHFIWQGSCLFFAYWFLTRLFFKNNVKTQYWLGMFFITLCLIIPVREFFIQLSINSSDFGIIQQLSISISSISTAGILSTGDLLISLIQKLIPYIVITWIIIVSLIGTHLLKSWTTLIKISKDTTIKVPESLTKKLEEASKKLSLKFHPIITISKKISLPATFGYFKPIVLFPASLMMKLPAEQLEVILFHELCHIKRADFLHNIIQLIVETLFFYHPLTKWISKDIRKNRELCCDELVLKLNTKPLVYAKALTNIASLYNENINNNNSSHIQIAATDGELFNRIKFLMMEKKSKSPITGMLISLIVLSLALLVFNSIKTNKNPNNFILNTAPTKHTLIETSKRPQFGSPSLEKIIEINSKVPQVLTKENKTKKIKSRLYTSPKKVTAYNKTAQYQEQKTKKLDSISTSRISGVRPQITVPKSTEQKIVAKQPPVIKSTNPIEKSKTPNTYPKIIKKVNPIYKRAARAQGIEGTVILSFKIDKNGRVKRIKVDKSSPLKLLDGDARSALRKWRFDPKSINTSNINNRYQQIFSFSLDSTNTCTSGDIGSHLIKQVCSDL